LTVDFLPFANDASSANVVTQADYLAAASGSGYVQNGFPAGTAQSNKANKALRQSSVMAAAMAQYLAAKLSQDVLDSGGAASVTAIQAQIAAAAAAIFPTGTKMLFIQTAAPTGWTKDTTHNDKTLRIVSGTAGSGGSAALSTAWTSVALSGTVAGRTLSASEIPAHTHSGWTSGRNVAHTHTGTTGGQSADHTHSKPRGLQNNGQSIPVNSGGQDGYGSNSTLGTSNDHTHTITTGSESADHAHYITTDAGTGGGTSHTHGLTMNAFTVTPAYVDAIICTKN
jgi:hypothetical protein